MKIKSLIVSDKVTTFIHKKTPQNWGVYYYLKTDKYYLPCLAYLVLNLSIRPAVSISLDFPV